MSWEYSRKTQWKRWFAWRPVKLDGGGEWKWLTTVYRRSITYRADTELYSVYYYGDLFDVLASDKSNDYGTEH